MAVGWSCSPVVGARFLGWEVAAFRSRSVSGDLQAANGPLKKGDRHLTMLRSQRVSALLVRSQSPFFSYLQVLKGYGKEGFVWGGLHEVVDGELVDRAAAEVGR